jgi:hypothetical protein
LLSSESAERPALWWLCHYHDMAMICVFLCKELCCVMLCMWNGNRTFLGWLIKEVCTWDSNASSRTSTRDGVGVYQTINWYLVLLIISKIIYVLYQDKNDYHQKQIMVSCPGALHENAVDIW